MKKKNKKRGISLIECVVALLLFSIVTAMAFTVYNLAYSGADDRIYEYKTKLMANNVLACFQSTDTMTDFMDAFSTAFDTPLEFDSGTDISKDFTVVIPGDGGGSFEFDPGNQYVSTRFTKVRATEASQTIEFLNAGDPVLSFSYNDEARYKADKTALANLVTSDGVRVYETNEEKALTPSTTKKVGIKLTASGSDSFSKKSSPFSMTSTTYKYSYELEYTVTESESSMTVTVTETVGRNAPTTIKHENKWTTTSVEKYYLNKNQILYFTKSPDSAESYKSNGYLYLAVYDGKTGARVTKSGAPVAVRIKCAQVKPGFWYNDTSKMTVTQVAEGTMKKPKSSSEYSYTSGSYTSISSLASRTGYYWEGFLPYVLDACFKDTTTYDLYNLNKNPTFGKDEQKYHKTVVSYCSFDKAEQITVTEPGSEKLMYTDFTPNVTAELNYAKIQPGGRVDVYNGDFSAETHEGVLLAKLNGAADFGTTFPDSGNGMRFKNGIGVHVSNVVFTDNGDKSKITFENNGKDIYTLQYDNHAFFLEDKEKIIGYVGSFRTNYSFTETGSRFSTDIYAALAALGLSGGSSNEETRSTVFYDYDKDGESFAYYLYRYTFIDKSTYEGAELTNSYTITYDGANTPDVTETASAKITVNEYKYIDESSIKTDGYKNQKSLPDSTYKTSLGSFSNDLELFAFKVAYSTPGILVKATIKEQCGVTSPKTRPYEDTVTNPSTIAAIREQTWENVSFSDISVVPSGIAAVRRDDDSSPYKIVIKGDDDESTEDDTLIFESKAKEVYYLGEGLRSSDFKIIDAESATSEEVSSLTRYFTYEPEDSEFGLYIEVTFSLVAYDPTVEPRINIWYMKKDELPQTVGAPLDMEDVYISYRKG